jgi:hypothetical protein
MVNAHSRFLVIVVAAVLLLALPVLGATEFAGTVLMVDAVGGKLVVKKDGTRFGFVTTKKTQYAGGLKSLQDVSKGDAVSVLYEVTGRQYVAQKITKGK